MSEISFANEQLKVEVGGETRRLIVRTPNGLAKDPALLINLGADADSSLNSHPQRIVSDALLAAGHRVASFDLPAHGEWKIDDATGLVGIAAAMGRGIDVFGAIAEMGRASVAMCLERKLARAGHIVVAGTSRGGLAALHVISACPEISAAALLAPVTNLPSLAEFAKMADSSIVQKSAAMRLVDPLAGRPICIAINTNDVRVSTGESLRFFAAYKAKFPASRVELYTAPGDTHLLLDPGYQYGAGFLLLRCVESSLVV